MQHSGGDETSVPKVERTRRIWRGTERKTHAQQRVVSGGAVLAGAAVRSCGEQVPWKRKKVGAVQVQQALAGGPQVLQSQDGR